MLTLFKFFTLIKNCHCKAIYSRSKEIKNKKDTVIKYDAFCLILSVFINFKFYCFLNGSTPSTPSILTSHSVVLLNVRFRVASFCLANI